MSGEYQDSYQEAEKYLIHIRRDGDYYLLHNSVTEIARLETGKGYSEAIFAQWTRLMQLDEMRAADYLWGIANGLMHCSMIWETPAYMPPPDDLEEYTQGNS